MKNTYSLDLVECRVQFFAVKYFKPSALIRMMGDLCCCKVFTI